MRARWLAIFVSVGLAVLARADEWEYRIVRLFPAAEALQLKELGKEGWELAAISNPREDTRFPKSYFKRRIGSGEPRRPDLSDFLEQADRIQSDLSATHAMLVKGKLSPAVYQGEPCVFLDPALLDSPAVMQKLRQLTNKTFRTIPIFRLVSNPSGPPAKIGELTFSP